ncbi:MAG: 30S ribosomal protein S8e [Thermoproteota archaeon]|nr:30S ribosomal protein S8e [Candidatus Brockarchaeota archaeon]
MSVYHGDIFKRKKTGGKSHPSRGKRKYEMGRPPTLTRLGENNIVEKVRVRGGGLKLRVIQAAYANVAVEKDRVVKAKVLDVVDNPANREFGRMKIMTKGAIIKTEVGNAIVTSKPGSNGVVNAKLVSAR